MKALLRFTTPMDMDPKVHSLIQEGSTRRVIRSLRGGAHQSGVGDFGRRGEVVGDAIKQQLDALVLVSAAHEDGHKGEAGGGAADGATQHVLIDGLLHQEQLAKLLVHVGQLLYQLLALLCCLCSLLC